MNGNKIVETIMEAATLIDPASIQQVSISASTIFGIGILCASLNRNIHRTVRRLFEPFEVERKKNATFVLNSYQINIVKSKASSIAKCTTSVWFATFVLNYYQMTSILKSMASSFAKSTTIPRLKKQSG